MNNKNKLLCSVLVVILFCGGLALWLYKAGPAKQVVMEKTEPVQKSLSTAFREPDDAEAPHIVGAVIEHISLDNVEADIIKSMPGISDAAIIEANDVLTDGVFEKRDYTIRDIRKPENRIVLASAGVDNFFGQIDYIDSTTGIVNYSISGNIFPEGAAHAAFIADDRGFFTLSSDSDRIGEHVAFIEPLDDYNKPSNSESILSHFYPNWNDLFKKAYDLRNQGINEGDECYDPNEKISDFDPELHADTGEIVFRRHFEQYHSGVCGGNSEIEIAIPISDILRETPQFVPTDSVLWRFKK